MTPKLLAISGPADGKSFPLTRANFTIGREPSNQICIPDALISRRHCRIVMSGDPDAQQFVLTDEGSVNGTQVSNTPIPLNVEHRLGHGEVIRIGNTSLLFLCQEEEEAAPSGEQSVELDDKPLDQRPTVAIERRESRYFSERQITTSLGSPALEPGATGQLIRDFQKILRFTLELSSLRELDALHRRLFELIGEVVPAERGAILLMQAAGGPAQAAGGEPTTAHIWRRSSPRDERFVVSRTLINRVLGESKSFLSDDPLASADLKDAKSLIESGIHSLLAMPLAVADKVYGVLYLDARNPAIRFNKDHLHLMAAIADAVAPAYESARQMAELRGETRRLRDQLDFDREMIGQSEPMIEVRELIARVAPTDFTVLIRGESGTGKELVARAIHLNSPRRDKPFVAVNCAVGPETLFESILFGHEKGAFTGAGAMKKGKLEEANGGTVFLDEIGELAPELQTKLLRVLQEREFERVGGNRAIPLDIRVIAATNKDLESAIKTREFRDDLFYRINALELKIPALRDRREDIPLLADYLIAKYAPQCVRRIRAISPEAYQSLMAYSWPGNVRELENALERALVFCNTDVIEAEDLPEHILEAAIPDTLPDAPEDTLEDTLPDTLETPPSNPRHQAPPPMPVLKYHEAVRDAKRRIIANSIQQAGGDLHQAARMLGLHVNNLYRHLRELGLRPPRTKNPS